MLVCFCRLCTFRPIQRGYSQMTKKGLLLLAAGTFAWQVGLADHETNSGIARSMEKIIPGVKPDRVSHSPIPGLYELVYGPHIVYVTRDGRYMVRGDVVDLEKRENVTEQKRKQARLNAVNGLGENTMIVFAPKEVKHAVTVFTDVECGFCRRLHQQINEYNARGVEIRYLAFPRAGIGSATYDKMVSVWCADDPQKAMTNAKAGRPVAPKRCENPVTNHYKMGRLVGITGTPTLILEDGELIPGYVPPERLIQLIEVRAGLAKRQSPVE